MAKKKVSKKKTIKKTIVKKNVKNKAKVSNISASKTLHYWSFPGEGLFLMKLESIILTFLSLLVFVIVMVETDYSLFSAAAMTLFFILIYLGISTIIRNMRKIEEHYHVKHDKLEIIRFVGNNVERVQILLKEVKKYKLDKFLLGAYLLTKDKRHSVYFNKLEDLEKLEKWLLKKK